MSRFLIVESSSLARDCLGLGHYSLQKLGSLSGSVPSPSENCPPHNLPTDSPAGDPAVALTAAYLKLRATRLI